MLMFWSDKIGARTHACAAVVGLFLYGLAMIGLLIAMSVEEMQ